MTLRGLASRLLIPCLVASSLPACDTDTAGATRSEPTRQPSSAEEPQAVRSSRARLEPWETVLTTQGNLEADESSSLGFKVPGRVVEISVDVGSILAPDVVITRLDEIDYRLRVERVLSQVKQTRALLGLPLDGDDDRVEVEETTQVRLARAVLAEAAQRRVRIETLRNDGVVDEAELDTAVSAARVAEERVNEAMQEVANLRAQLLERRSDLALARQQLADCSLRSPYEGVVVRRRGGRGDFVTAGQAVFDVVRIDPIRLRIAVPEKFGAQVSIGQSVRFSVEGDAVEYESKVARLPPALEQSNRTLFLEADVANSAVGGAHRLRAGSFAKVTLVLDPTTMSLTVPASAIRSFAGVDRVVAVEDGKAKEILVTVGRKEEARVEILKGISEGLEVILDPGSLTTGRAVRVTGTER